jgi:hypothetical protein
MLCGLDDNSVVVLQANVIKHYTAQSQSIRHMNKDEFQKSKTAVLEYVAVEMLGTTVEALTKNAEEVA